jgi:hypothetical protein
VDRFGALTEGGKNTLGVRTSYSGKPLCNHVMPAMKHMEYLAASTYHKQLGFWPWQTYLPNPSSRYFSLHKCIIKGVLEELCREPVGPQTSNQLASSLIRAPNSKSGGYVFESTVWTTQRTKGEETLGQVFLQWREKIPLNFRQ